MILSFLLTDRRNQIQCKECQQQTVKVLKISLKKTRRKSGKVGIKKSAKSQWAPIGEYKDGEEPF